MLPDLRKNLSLALAASGAVLALQSSPAQAITTWDWSFTTDIADQYGSGTFTTDDVVPTAGVSYTITAISGTYNREGTIHDILGLSDYQSPDNAFQWDGTSSSPILSTYSGISFEVIGYVINLYNDSGSKYAPIDS